MATQDYMALIKINGGSSWAWGESPEAASDAAVKQCVKDWGRDYELETLRVGVFDMRGREGWLADERGVVDSETGEVLPVLGVTSVDVKDAASAAKARRRAV